MTAVEDASELVTRLFGACLRSPDSAQLKWEYGKALLTVGRYHDAVAVLGQAVQLDPMQADFQESLGLALERMGDHEGAAAALGKAIAIAPNRRSAHLSLANLHLHRGQDHEALHHYSTLLKLDPNDAYAFYHLMLVGAISAVTDAQVSYFQGYLYDEKNSTRSRVLAGFGLAWYFSATGCHGESFEYLVVANRLHRDSFEFSIGQLADQQEAIKSTFVAGSQATLPQRDGDPLPIFLVGTPRSGSTLCEQILGAHSSVGTSGERLFFDSIIESRAAGSPDGWARLIHLMDVSELERVRLQFLEAFRSQGKRLQVVTDKSLDNYRYIGIIKSVFPQAKFVYCDRHRLASGYSMYQRYFTGHQPFAYDLMEIGAYQQLVADMMSFWGGIVGDDVFTLRHETLVDSPEATIRQLLDFCGLDFEADCLQSHKRKGYVATASTRQVRTPINKEHTEHWKQYKAFLSPLIEGFQRPVVREVAASPANANHAAERVQVLMDGLAAQKAGDIDTAIERYRRVLNRNKLDEQARHLLGMAEHEAKHYDAAIEHLDACIKISSTPWLVAYHLGRVYVDAGRPEMARKNFLQALSLKPDYAEAHNSLGLLYQSQGNFDSAITSFHASINANPELLNPHDNLIQILKDQDRDAELKALCEAMLEKNPAMTQYMRELAGLERRAGKLSRANALYRRVIEINPRSPKSYYGLSLSLENTLDDDDINSMIALLESENAKAPDRTALAFALARAYEKRGDIDKSWDYYCLANKTHRESIEYSMPDQRRFFRQIKSTYNANFAECHRVKLAQSAAHIFIVGMPRSGTTLLEQMLSAHSQVKGAGELSHMGDICREFCRATSTHYPKGMAKASDLELARMGRHYHSRTLPLRGRAEYLVDKMPGNFFHLAAIREALPEAKIIHIKRDPQDTCLSIFKNHFTESHSYAYDLCELAEYYECYQDLMEHWDALYGESFLSVHYEELVTDPENALTKLLAYCGLDFESDCLRFHENPGSVKTASLEQVRQPIYTTGIASSAQFSKYLATSALGRLAV